MTDVLPEPVALDLPEENAAALAEVAASLDGVVFGFGAMGADLAGPAASAPGWLGRDAAAAAAQVTTTSALVNDVHDAVGRALERLRRHAEVLEETRHRIAALRSQQDEEYGAADARLAAAPLHPALSGGPTQQALFVAVGDELSAGEASRQQQHAVLLADLRADALDTARTLAACTAAVGGTGHGGDAARVVVQLAGELPGWGDGELSARGAALARALTGPATLDQIDSLAGRSIAFAGTSAFADAVLRCLGPEGVRYLLATLGEEPEADGSPLAALLATALGAARPTGGPVDAVGEVLNAHLVRADDADGSEDAVVLGMGAVLAAAADVPGRGPSSTTIASWARQMLEREGAQGRSALAATPSSSADDPVDTALGLLARAADPSAAAVLLAGRDVWSALLARHWGDGGLLLSRVVDLAGAAPDAGATVARSGLAALGTGLSRAGVEAWGVRRETAAALAPSLGRLVAGHLDVVTGLLHGIGGSDRPPSGDDIAVRGLGFLMADARAESLVSAPLMAWVAQAPRTPEAVAVAGATVGAFVAVREYGQRLSYVLAAAQACDAAVDREFTFDVVTLPLHAVPGPPGAVAGVGKDMLAHWIGADGLWSVGPDRGPTFGPDDAARTAVTAVGAADPRTAGIAAGSSRSSFRRGLAHLGLPEAPVSETLSDALLEEVTAGMPVVERTMLEHGLEGVTELGR